MFTLAKGFVGLFGPSQKALLLSIGDLMPPKRRAQFQRALELALQEPCDPGAAPVPQPQRRLPVDLDGQPRPSAKRRKVYQQLARDTAATKKRDTAEIKKDTAATKGDTAATKGDTAATKGDTAATKGDTAETQGTVPPPRKRPKSESRSEGRSRRWDAGERGGVRPVLPTRL